MVEKDIEFNTETGEEVVPKKVETIDGGDDLVEDEEGTHADDDRILEDEDAADNEAHADSTEDEREEIRARRREERKQRKTNQREREDTLRRELAARDSVINDMRGRLDAIDRRNTGSEQAQLAQEKDKTAKAYAYYRDQIKLGTEAGNGAVVADATEKLMQTQRRFDELVHYEKAYQQRPQQTQSALDPRLVNNAKSWMGKNSWYDPAGKDQDSRITLTIDQNLAEEGWDPTTPAYWDELETRVRKYLPHRTAQRGTSTARPKSVVPGGGREGSSSSNAGTYKLSAERVQAMKDSGNWSDPLKRAAMIKAYKSYDAESNS